MEAMTWKKRPKNVTIRHVIAGSAKARRIAVNIVKMQERRLSFPVIVDTLAAPFTKSGRPPSCEIQTAGARNSILGSDASVE